MLVARRERDYTILKRKLNEFYGVEFDVEEYSNNSAAEDENADDELEEKYSHKFVLKNTNKDIEKIFKEDGDKFILCELFSEALSLCNDAFNTFEDDIKKIIYVDKFVLSGDLLKFVVMDSFMNLDADLFESLSSSSKKEAYYSSLAQHFYNFNSDKKHLYNYYDLHPIARNNFWFNEIVEFGVEKDKNDDADIAQENNEDVKKDQDKNDDVNLDQENNDQLENNDPDNDVENSTNKNSGKKGGKQKGDNNIIISKYLDNFSALLIYKIKMNPFNRLSDAQYDDFKKLYPKSLYGFFEECFELLSKENKPYNFFCKDLVSRVRTYYAFDSMFDFDNMVYLDKKINEMLSEEEYLKKEAKKVLYQCFLIPDYFSKKSYIDCIFDEYLLAKNSDEEEMSYEDKLVKKYERLREAKKVILLLAKVWLPVLSACFYVLLFEKYGSKEKVYAVLKKYIRCDVAKYYKNREAARVLDESTKQYLLEGKDSCLTELYELIRSNIFINKKQYDDIKASLSLFENNTPDIKRIMFNLFMQIKISDNKQNIADPIPYERS